jgi:HAE1 family hydrophobic/amphiphilic exporter-1
MQPLAIAVVGGLLFSTALTLVVLPCAYLIVKGGTARLRRWVVGAPEAEREPAGELATTPRE